jgi:hypothetical protein
MRTAEGRSRAQARAVGGAGALCASVKLYASALPVDVAGNEALDQFEQFAPVAYSR